MNTPSCDHGDRVYREGTGKTGKPYKAWFCPQPKGEPQCAVEWATNTPTASPSPSSGPSEATRLLESIDSKLAVLIELARENSLKDNPLK